MPLWLGVKSGKASALGACLDGLDQASARPMIKSELILRIAEQNPQLYERDVELVIRTILNQIADALVAGDRVEIRGLGVFSVRDRRSRSGRNPKSGQAVAVTEKRAIAFKPSTVMHVRLNPPEGSTNSKLKPTISGLSRHV